MPNTLRDSSKGKQTVLANFRLHKDEYQALKRQAEQCRISFSELLRRIALAAIPNRLIPNYSPYCRQMRRKKKRVWRVWKVARLSIDERSAKQRRVVGMDSRYISATRAKTSSAY